MIAADIIDMASRASSLPGQGLMLLGIIILGYLARYQHKENKLTAQENKLATEVFFARIEAKEASIQKERVDRITMLMEILRDDTAAKIELKHTIDNNTSAIGELRRMIENWNGRQQHA